MVRIKVLRHTGNTQETNGQNSGGREALKSRRKGTRKEALLEVDDTIPIHQKLYLHDHKGITVLQKLLV